MRAPPRGLSQLATSFFATQAKSSTIRRRCVTDEYNIPADACANPMHGLIALPAVRARALALHIGSMTRRCILIVCCALHRYILVAVRGRSVLDCSSKEVIRLQVPLQPPCYDFSPLAELRFDLPNKSKPRLNPTRVKRRAVCARSRDVFTAR